MPEKETDTVRKQSKKRKLLFTVLFVIINISVVAVTAVFEFSKDASKAEQIPFLGLNFRYLIAAAGCVAVLLLAETLKYMLMMKHNTGKSDFKLAFQVTAIGKYYDCVTPLNAGGQPFQVHFLSRRGLSRGTAASMPITSYLVSHFVFAVMSLAVFIFGGDFVSSAAIRVTSYVGLGLYLSIPFAIIFFTVAPAAALKVFNFFIFLLHKLRILKNRERAENTMLTEMTNYRDAVIGMSGETMLLLKLGGLSVCYHTALCSLPFFVLRTFGGAATWIESFCICVFIYTAINFIPTPGNAGAAEGSFYLLFSVLTSNYLFWAMLVWRFFCYYCFIAIGACVLAWGAVRKRKQSAPSQ